ncbi:unnamed protein product [Arctogadus glacialis]
MSTWTQRCGASAVRSCALNEACGGGGWVVRRRKRQGASDATTTEIAALVCRVPLNDFEDLPSRVGDQRRGDIQAAVRLRPRLSMGEAGVPSEVDPAEVGRLSENVRGRGEGRRRMQSGVKTVLRGWRAASSGCLLVLLVIYSHLLERVNRDHAC